MSTTAESPKLRASAIALSETIAVQVGTEEKKYTLHTRLLTFYSGYFRGALSGNFKENSDGVIPLRDIELEAFDVFVDWLYEKTLPLCIKVSAPRGGISLRHRVYVLADGLLVKGLKSALMDHVFRHFPPFDIVQPPQLLIYYYENLP